MKLPKKLDKGIRIGLVSLLGLVGFGCGKINTPNYHEYERKFRGLTAKVGADVMGSFVAIKDSAGNTIKAYDYEGDGKLDAIYYSPEDFPENSPLKPYLNGDSLTLVYNNLRYEWEFLDGLKQK